MTRRCCRICKSTRCAASGNWVRQEGKGMTDTHTHTNTQTYLALCLAWLTCTCTWRILNCNFNNETRNTFKSTRCKPMPLALEGETRKSSDYWQMQQQKQRQQQLQQMQQVCSLNRFILCTIYVHMSQISKWRSKVMSREKCTCWERRSITWERVKRVFSLLDYRERKHFDVNRFALIIRRQFSKDPYYLHTSFLLYNGTDFNSIFNLMFTVKFYWIISTLNIKIWKDLKLID